MSSEQQVKAALQDSRIRDFVCKNLRRSLEFLHLDPKASQELIDSISNINRDLFCSRHCLALHKAYTDFFLKVFCPQYFAEHIIPHLPSCDKVIDLGCGTGALVNQLSASPQFKHVTGIEITRYPEWETYKNAKNDFHVVEESNFFKFLTEQKPDLVVLTWVLHHMEYEQQQRYIEKIHKILAAGSRIVILEDAYAESVNPEMSQEIHQEFLQFSRKDRNLIIGVNDWIGNCVLGQRKEIPMPFAYRTLEDWCTFFQNVGFHALYRKYIGFPIRDVINPQSILVLGK